MRKHRSLFLSLSLLSALGAAMAGCGGKRLPVLERHAFDFKTTGLFQVDCKDDEEAPARTEDPAEGSASPPEEPPPPQGPEASLNRCSAANLSHMVEAFMTIREADETRGFPGDTIDEVRQKGFTIYVDRSGKVRRPNTRVLYGNDALAAVGMPVSPPPLQKPEEVKAYTEFMGQHYAEEYVEKDMRLVIDRICINNRNSTEIGDDRVFAIVWRGGHVFKRVIKGGPVNNPRQERAFLLCPGGFVADTVTGSVSTSVRSFTPTR